MCELMQPGTELVLGEEARGAGVALCWRRRQADLRGSPPASSQQLGGEVQESAWQARLGLADVGALRKAIFLCGVDISASEAE